MIAVAMRTARKFSKLILALTVSASATGVTMAEVYKCTIKGGKFEMRDYPCDLANRPVSPMPSASTTESIRNSIPSTSNVPRAGFGNSAQYQAARNICLSLMTQHDTTRPLMRCAMGDTSCLSRASDEISAISRRLISHPEWKRQQCDLVVQIERAASPEKKTFEVVGAIRGCKYFVGEQDGSYSLAEEWMCFRPSRGDTGQGDISTYGIKNVNINGLSCDLYIDDWQLSRSRASEKLQEKCHLR